MTTYPMQEPTSRATAAVTQRGFIAPIRSATPRSGGTASTSVTVAVASTSAPKRRRRIEATVVAVVCVATAASVVAPEPVVDGGGVPANELRARASQRSLELRAAPRE